MLRGSQGVVLGRFSTVRLAESWATALSPSCSGHSPLREALWFLIGPGLSVCSCPSGMLFKGAW